MESKNVRLLPGEQEKIDAALDALEQDPHAPNQLSVRVSLHVHREYPKHVDGRLVRSRAEERKLRQGNPVEQPAPASE
jgi:hypothetical protein